MYSAEVLSQLRSLNWLAQEVRRVPPGSLEGLHVQDQIAAIRARLPNSILTYHDRLATRGQPSVVAVKGTSCSACHLKLPRGIVSELALAGRFSVCPNCGVFLWSGETRNDSLANKEAAHGGSASVRAESGKDDTEVVRPTKDISSLQPDDTEVVPPLKIHAASGNEKTKRVSPSLQSQGELKDSTSTAKVPGKVSARRTASKVTHV